MTNSKTEASSAVTGSETAKSTSFNFYNLGNLLGYILNTVIVYGFGNFGWANSSNTGDISRKYQAIITPSSWAFSIWGPIYIFEFLWVVWQLLPSQRNSPGVSAAAFWYVGVCVAQAGWQLSFTYEVMWLTLVCMFSILGCLVTLHVRLQRYEKIWKGYFLWQFPFSLHLGWIIAASILNVSLVMVAYGASTSAQFGVGIASLVLVVMVALAFLSRYPVDFTPPLVLTWALGAIYAELESPIQSITARFTQDQIKSIQTGALVVLSLVLVFVLIKLIYVFLVQRPRHHQQQEATSDEDVEEGRTKTDSE